MFEVREKNTFIEAFCEEDASHPRGQVLRKTSSEPSLASGSVYSSSGAPSASASAGGDEASDDYQGLVLRAPPNQGSGGTWPYSEDDSSTWTYSSGVSLSLADAGPLGAKDELGALAMHGGVLGDLSADIPQHSPTDRRIQECPHCGVHLAPGKLCPACQQSHGGSSGSSQHKRHSKPCKFQRDKYRRYVASVISAATENPTTFDIEQIDMPYYVSTNEELRKKFIRRIKITQTHALAQLQVAGGVHADARGGKVMTTKLSL